MRTEDHIWALVAKCLAGEAIAEELRELDEWLQKYPVIEWQANIIANWWGEDTRKIIDQRGTLLFDRIKQNINSRKDPIN